MNDTSPSSAISRDPGAVSDRRPPATGLSVAYLVDHLNEVVFRTDCSGAWLFLNPAWTTLTGFTVDEALGRIYTDFVHPDDRTASLEGFLPLIRRERATARLRLRLLTKAGGFKWTSIYLRALFHPLTGKLDGAVGTLDDITELMAAERVMREEKERAEMADQTKSQFLATMSHELRTPMNAIIGLTDLVLDTPLTSEQMKHLRMVKSSAGSLLEIIEEVLLYSNLEGGRVKPEPAPFDLREILGQTLAPLLFRAMEANLELNWRVDESLPQMVVGDALRLRQILNQLVGNSLKFTPEGSVAVDVTRAMSDSRDEVCIQFSVTDTGPGISDERRAHLFSPFSKREDRSDRRQTGAGLGLAVTAKLLDLMKGRIWLDPAHRSGSRFVFEIRLGLPTAFGQSTAALAGPQRKGAQILVAEDNMVNQHLIRHLLVKMGHQPTLVANGKLCVEEWKRRHYDLILMDIQMPEMSGIEATQAIRAQERQSGHHIPIIAVTANAIIGDRDQCLNAGMDEYITKPIKNELLEQAIDRFTRPPESPLPEAANTLPRGPFINFNEALSGADDDLELLRNLFELFLVRTPECLNKIENALGAEDSGQVMIQAHSLKGALRMLHAPVVEEVAYRVERAGRAKDLAEAAAGLKELRPIIDRVYEEIATALREHPLPT